jgi:hypothetical protein
MAYKPYPNFLHRRASLPLPIYDNYATTGLPNGMGPVLSGSGSNWRMS